MKLINIQEAFTRKSKRQLDLAKYSNKAKFHCGGNAFHIGKVSMGYKWCFGNPDNIFSWSIRLGEDVGLPNVCNFACTYCFPSEKGNSVKNNYTVPSDWKIHPDSKEHALNYFRSRKKIDFLLYSFTGFESEPLFYLPVIEEYMKFYINEIESLCLKRGYSIIYTNGVFLNKENILRLKKARIDEVRVNIGASFFSNEVYKNIEEAVKHIPVVTIEVPLWKYYRKGLFKMLPIINELGVKHLDLCQVRIDSKEGFRKIMKSLPENTEYYKISNQLMVDDEGLCEELMKEVIDKNYNYSVMDFNCFVIGTVLSKFNYVTFEEEPFDKPDFMEL